MYPKISKIPANFSWWSRVLDQLYDGIQISTNPANLLEWIGWWITKFQRFQLIFLGGAGCWINYMMYHQISTIPANLLEWSGCCISKFQRFQLIFLGGAGCWINYMMIPKFQTIPTNFSWWSWCCIIIMTQISTIPATFA
jgi:hypothetical protein